jgi:hypothetical protein
MKKYYGIQWWYGNSVTSDGKRLGDYYWFASKKQRDNWVSLGAPYRGNGSRDYILASDNELRRVMRDEYAKRDVQEFGQENQ